ncbi:hypothetical protein ACLB2K_008329 [Fragaria x ananassa]
MASKISTLTALLLWHTMSIGSSWAGKVESWTEWSTKGLALSQKDGEKLSDVPTKPWLNLLHGAEVALEANKYQTALTLVTGVNARQNKMEWSNEDDRHNFRDAVNLIEQAVEADNKVKAVALINSLTAEITKSGLHVYPDVAGGGGGVQPRGYKLKEHEMHKAEEILNAVYQLLRDNKELYARDKAEEAIQAAAHDLGIEQLHEEELATASKVEQDQGEEEDHDPNQERKKKMLETFMQQAFTAIKGEQRAKAEKILRTIYHILKNDKNLAREEKAIKFLQAIEETEKYVKEDARDKAEHALQGAAIGLGIQPPQDQYVRNKKTGASGSEL